MYSIIRILVCHLLDRMDMVESIVLIIGNASRLCLHNGTWDHYSDYTNCKELPNANHEPDVVELTTTIYLAGYTISLGALLVAVYIFWRYKDLRCLRNTIHMNLMLSYIFADFVWILTFVLHVFLPTHAASCVMLMLSLHYFHLTNFFWMLVEGLYLYILVVKTFQGDKFKLPMCTFIGWGVPALFVLAWGITKGVMTYVDDQQHTEITKNCPWGPDVFDWIYQLPAVVVLFTNFVFLIIIMWASIRKTVLITKLRSANSVETQQYQKAAKALLVLIPLLGVTYIFVLVGPTEGISKNIYECLRAVLLSTQGFTVALFYCFLNTEVKNTVGHHLNAWHTHRNIGSQRNRSSGRDWSKRSRDSVRMYILKKRESSCSVGTTSSLVPVNSGRNNSRTRSQFTPPLEET